MEMKKVLEQEGRDAKNLMLYQLVVEEDANNKSPAAKKPPVIPKLLPNIPTIKKQSQQNAKPTSGPRVRSASTGRDKKSELQARYWALLFGNLQRAVDEIYQTVECYENMSSCQEAILVLENYIRDFKALAEWFRVSWDYEATPLPQRPQSLAWEVRKSNPTPRIRTRSLSSPTVSGKSSPCFSGKSSPCSTVEDGKGTPRKNLRLGTEQQVGLKSGRVNIRDLFSKDQTKRNLDAKNAENNTKTNVKVQESHMDNDMSKNLDITKLSWNDRVELQSMDIVQDDNDQKSGAIEQAEETPQIVKHDKYAQTDLEDENLTLAEIREKMRCAAEEQKHTEESNIGQPETIVREPTAVELTIQKLDEMENAFLVTEIKGNNMVDINSKQDLPQIAETITSHPCLSQKSDLLHSPKIVDTRKSQSSPMKYSSILNRPATAGTPIKATPVQRVVGRSSRPQSAAQKPAFNNLPSGTNSAKRAPPKIVTMTPASNRNDKNSSRSSVLVRNTSNLAKSEKCIPSNVANRLSARSKTMIDMNDKNSRLSRPSIISFSKFSKEDINSSSSTLKASNEKIGDSKTSLYDSNRSDRIPDFDRRSEPKQVTSENGSNDGWLTVKTRRRSSLHWANRFNQPTGYASLPTLSLLNGKEKDENGKVPTNKEKKMNHEKVMKNKSETSKSEKSKSLKPEIKNAKAKVNSLPTRAANKGPVTSKSAREASDVPKSSNNRQNLIKRQKSDLTGLKMTTLHREFMRSEKINKSNKINETGEPQNSPDLQNCFEDIELNKIDIKIQTNREFSKTIGELYDSLPNMTNGIRETVLSSCDEGEEKDDTESDEDQRKLLEEQENLERQIRELENTEIDVDTETDETDCEVNVDLEENINEVFTETDDFICFSNDENLTLEQKYQALLSEMSGGEREETLATLQAYVSRHPGRAQELHQKLSSPSRRRSLQETLKKYQIKQARAQEKRELLQKEKSLKIQQLLARVEDVKAAKQQLIEEKRLKMEERLQRAAENRNQHLRDIIRKAHDEEEKLKEIAFIKNLEAQNKRLDFIESCKEQEGRLQDLEQERQKKAEEKAAKEAAVERRRQELEKARQRRLEKMNETRLEREQRVGKLQEQREKQRQAIAREKARDREERLLALQVQQQQSAEELQRKILQKQKESAKRHEENIEHIRQRALELTIPNRNVDENDRAASEERDDGGDLSSTVSDVSREHSKAFKKKIKKLKLRMAQKTEEYLKELQPVPLHMKRESQVPKYLNLVIKGGGAQGLERPLGQLLRLMAKAQVSDFQCFWLMNGLGIIGDVITNGMEPNSETSKRAVVIAVQLYRNACSLCPQIARHAILANSITLLFDALLQSLQLPEEKSPQHPVELSTELMLACTVALSPVNSMKQSHPKVVERLPDVISYAVTTGLIEVLSRRCMKIRESIENYQSVVLSLLATLGLLTKFAELCPVGPTDTTRFLGAAKSTELFGTIPLLYATVVPIGECIPPRTISLAAATFNLLVSMAVLDLSTFQEVLSGESLSMKFLDVVTILLKYCGSKCTINEKSETQAVIIDLIATLGFFSANNKKNQELLTSEQCSIIIKSLTKLPQHFNVVIYPTLFTIIYDNDEAKQVVARDFNVDFLDEYSKSEIGRKNRLVSVLKPKH